MKVLMCGSSLSVKGGMVSVIRNYLSYKDWKDVDIVYVPTHIESNKLLLIAYFTWACCRIMCLLIFSKVDLAHLHTAERGSFYRKAFLARMLKLFGIRTIMHHHAAEFEQFYNSLSCSGKGYVSHILEQTDVNIVLSQRLIPMIKDKASQAKVEVLYNAVNTYHSNPYNQSAKNILFLGRLGERKGTYDLLKAIKSLDSQVSNDILFYLCGDGEVDKVKAMISEMQIGHRIAHVGWIDGEQKKTFLSNTMINVLPSYNEGLPMTILETMAYGIPNISTCIASIPEVLHNEENGILITPGDVNALTDGLFTLIQNEELRNKYSQCSFSLIQNDFSLNANIEQLKVIYGQFR